MKQQGLTLIQGPPGTGKTKTVLGTLSVLLHSYHKSDEDDEEPLILNWKKSEQNLKNSKDLNPWLRVGYVDWRDEAYLDNE